MTKQERINSLKRLEGILISRIGGIEQLRKNLYEAELFNVITKPGFKDMCRVVFGFGESANPCESCLLRYENGQGCNRKLTREALVSAQEVYEKQLSDLQNSIESMSNRS